MREIAWKKLCCPVDFSDESRAPLLVAADLARRLGAALTILHVEDARHPSDAAKLEAWARETAAGGLQVGTAQATGDPKLAIAEYASINGFDAIVMGTHGLTGRARVLVGSVAENTVRNARCPVMVIHPDWISRR
jgi:nucleotide-binding universal stress UspA family protein